MPSDSEKKIYSISEDEPLPGDFIEVPERLRPHFYPSNTDKSELYVSFYVSNGIIPIPLIRYVTHKLHGCFRVDICEIRVFTHPQKETVFIGRYSRLKVVNSIVCDTSLFISAHKVLFG